MILSKKHKFIWFRSPSPPIGGFYRAIQKLNELSILPASVEESFIITNGKNSFTNNYWGEQKIPSDYRLMNLQQGINNQVLDTTEINLDEYKSYYVIYNPIKRFIDMCCYLKSSGVWMKALFEMELNEVSGPSELQIDHTTPLCQQNVLPYLNPAFQSKYFSITLDEVGERIIDYPFMLQIFDAIRMPQSYYSDPRTIAIPFDKLKGNIIEFYDEHDISDFRYIPNTEPHMYDHHLTEKDFSSTLMDRVKEVYSEDIEIYNTAMNI